MKTTERLPRSFHMILFSIFFLNYDAVKTAINGDSVRDHEGYKEMVTPADDYPVWRVQ